MSLISIFPKTANSRADTLEVIAVSAAGARSSSVQRMQIGLAGLGTMILLVGLAQVINDRAQLSEAETVPASASTMAPIETVPVQNDPLAEAGVVPDLPAEPVDQPAQEQAIMPEQGNVPPPR